jgi:hypothetical protein
MSGKDMRTDDVHELTKSAESGSIITLVFLREFLSALTHLKAMMEAKEILAENEGVLLHLNRVIESGKWGIGPEPTKFIFKTTDTFDAAKFAGHLAYALDTFKIVYAKEDQQADV